MCGFTEMYEFIARMINNNIRRVWRDLTIAADAI